MTWASVERQDLFEALAESAPDAIVTIDDQSRILFANSSVERILGFAPQELIGASLTRIIPERFRAAHEKGIARYLGSGRRNIPWTGVALPALRKDGDEVPVEISFGELTGQDGRRVFSGFIRDVSERVRHERELEAARAQAEAALAELRALHSITDAALAQSDYDAMLRELLTRLRAELHVDSTGLLLLDSASGDLMVAASAGLPESDLHSERVKIGHGIAGRVAQSGKPLRVEDIRRLEGVHPAFANQVHSAAAVPIRIDASVIGVVVIGSRVPRRFTDSEERLLEIVADRMAGVLARTRLFEAERRAHRQLRELNAALEQRAAEEQVLRTVAHNVAAAARVPEIMRQIAEGGLISSGAAGAYVEQVIESEGEVEVLATAGDQTPPIGTRVSFPGSLTEEIISRREPVFLLRMEGVGVSMAPYLRRHCPGCSVLVLPLYNKLAILGALVLVQRAGEPAFGTGVINRARILGDLASLALQRLIALNESETRRAEAENAVRSRDEVLSIVSHDLRNPVNTVVMSAELLRDPDIALPESQRAQTLDIILRSAHRMNRLIQDLLDVQRIEGGRFAVRCKPEDASSLATEACEAFRQIVSKKSIVLECDIPSSLPEISVDRDRILQVLSNYLNNAAKFTPAEGRIRLAVTMADGEIRFTVSDTGPGIPADDLAQVFSRFWQAKRTSHLGAGLGLAIAKGVADAHRGRVWVESVVGQGSTFGFAVPVLARGS